MTGTPATTGRPVVTGTPATTGRFCGCGPSCRFCQDRRYYQLARRRWPRRLTIRRFCWIHPAVRSEPDEKTPPPFESLFTPLLPLAIMSPCHWTLRIAGRASCWVASLVLLSPAATPLPALSAEAATPLPAEPSLGQPPLPSYRPPAPVWSPNWLRSGIEPTQRIVSRVQFWPIGSAPPFFSSSQPTPSPAIAPSPATLPESMLSSRASDAVVADVRRRLAGGGMIDGDAGDVIDGELPELPELPEIAPIAPLLDPHQEGPEPWLAAIFSEGMIESDRGSAAPHTATPAAGRPDSGLIEPAAGEPISTTRSSDPPSLAPRG